MTVISQTTFWIDFNEWNDNWPKVSIGSGNGLVSNMRQAIAWTNVDPAQGDMGQMIIVNESV